MILLLCNALLGLVLFEYAWYKSARFRKPIPELDNMMPGFRRYDAQRWRKWAFYPGAMTVLIPRFLFGVVIAILLCLIIKIAMIGHARNEPLGCCRRPIIRWTYKIVATLFQLFTNFNFVTWSRLTLEDVNHYEEWLGPRS